MSNFLRNIDCPSCGSHMRAAVYKDGGIYCHKCSYTQKGDTVNHDMMDDTGDFASAYVEEDVLKGRKINSDTARFFGVTEHAGSVTFPYGAKAKVRGPNKTFKVSGGKLSSLFGQDKYAKGGKVVCITEGEFDAMSAHQMLSGTVPCVSVPNGAAAALKDCQEAFEWLDSFDSVVVCFDSDKPGQEASAQVAELFGAKAKLVRFEAGYKDPNDYLVNTSAAKFVKAFWAAEAYRPDGIVSVADAREALSKPKEMGIPWFMPSMNKWTHGRRPGELYILGAGVGIGKTDVNTQQIAYDITMGLKVGVFYLEQPFEETVMRICGKLDGIPYHVPGRCPDNETFMASLDALDKREQVWFYRHFGAKDWDTIKAKIRYMVKALGVKSIYIDPITALSANMEDERRGLDKVMADMASLAQELQVMIHAVSHLSTPPDGKSHEAGYQVRERDFTGSRALARWGHMLWGIERNKTHDDPNMRNLLTVRILKERYTGVGTGQTFHMMYDSNTGLLNECESPEEKDEVL